jgi:hypothetical protein
MIIEKSAGTGWRRLCPLVISACGTATLPARLSNSFEKRGRRKIAFRQRWMGVDHFARDGRRLGGVSAILEA